MLRIKTKERLNQILELLLKIHAKSPEAFTSELLLECQQAVIAVGENIERELPDRRDLVEPLEAYCELAYQFSQHLQENVGQLECMNTLITSVRRQIAELPTVREIVFFPYKASMWDSLESVYLAAKEDSECEVFCVPIPYFDKNRDQSLGEMHYEGDQYPDDVEITDWKSYDFEERRPDIMYIHNPYDEYNYVTSVHPRYYSANLKRYTDTLVYIPYYSTSGDMAEGQRMCPAYMHADYIVIQAPGYRSFFDERIPDKKFLPFGSPKFDRVIRKCKNPPAPPAAWRKRLEGRKVYFYNTSITGMLSDTESFLKKMRYVFSCFQDRKDTCLVWRPHPLLESTFDSLRPAYRKEYDSIRQEFWDSDYGIYDDTADITDTIALCDAYIGDAGSSVTSLFGIAGKPLFILNNRIHSLPDTESWRGQLLTAFSFFEKNRFMVTQGNKLYISEPDAWDFHYFCDLSMYAQGGYYFYVHEIGEKLYACPLNAQNILVIGRKGIERTVELEGRVNRPGAFFWSWKWDKYLILIPKRYPALVRYDTKSGEIRYLTEHIDVFTREVDQEWKVGGCWLDDGLLYICSPTDNRIYKLEVETCKAEVLSLSVKNRCGVRYCIKYRDEFWLFSYGCRKEDGSVSMEAAITRWDPATGEVREYRDFPEGFRCQHPVHGYRCMEEPFSWPAFYEDEVYIPPCWANMYLKLDMRTDKIEQWIPSYEDGEGVDYYDTQVKSSFVGLYPNESCRQRMILSWPKRKLYRLDLQENTCEEMEIHFDREELLQQEPGFGVQSEWQRYGCMENAFNSLSDFLDGKISGHAFDRDEQLKSYGEIAANHDGTCGEKLHQFIKGNTGMAKE